MSRLLFPAKLIYRTWNFPVQRTCRWRRNLIAFRDENICFLSASSVIWVGVLTAWGFHVFALTSDSLSYNFLLEIWALIAAIPCEDFWVSAQHRISVVCFPALFDVVSLPHTASGWTVHYMFLLSFENAFVLIFPQTSEQLHGVSES